MRQTMRGEEIQIDWPTLRVAHKDGKFEVLWPGELAGPFKRVGYVIKAYAPPEGEKRG